MIRKATIRLPLIFLGLLFFSSRSFCTNYVVTVQNFSFSPAMVDAVVGDTITWQWVSGTHTTTCNSSFPGTSLPPGAAPWDEPITSASPSYSYVIAVDGEYDYVCTIHAPNMAGIIMAVPLPVELVSFSATVNGGLANLSWKTSTEKNNSGFEIQRKTENVWESVSFVQGHGTTTKENNYSFADDISNLQSDEVFYRLKQIDFNGIYQYSKVVQVSKIMPSEFSLMQNFPNPFNPTTQIRYSIPMSTHVLLKVYDSNGSEVASIVNQDKPAGNYTIDFNAARLASGTYYYTITAGNFTETKKMILMK
jgi:plastocyanin/flagellar assembly factor FliW